MLDLVGNDTATKVLRPRTPDESLTTLRAVPRGTEDPDLGPEPAEGISSGDRVGRYQVGRKLGQGRFGIVFEACDTHLDRMVALKVLSPTQAIDVTSVRRFVAEGRATSRVNHPGIVTVFDCGEDRGTAYIAMELMQGESLASRLGRSGALALPDAMEIARQIASALHAAHEMGVIHRDLKPDNIFLVPDPAAPSGERVKVLDFGLAKRVTGVRAETQADQTMGTPRYMAPEQARSAGDVDRRADIYSLGCVLYELVCGRTPFDGEMLALFEQHQHTRAPRAHELVPHIAHGLDALIARMLEKLPAARPATMAIVQRELQAAGALAPGAAVTVRTEAAPASAAMAHFAIPMPLAALHAMPSVVVTPSVTPYRAAVFGPGTGMIPVPRLATDPSPADVVAIAAPPPPLPRRRSRLYGGGAALLMIAIALLATIALRQTAPSEASVTSPQAAVAAP